MEKRKKLKKSTIIIIIILMAACITGIVIGSIQYSKLSKEGIQVIKTDNIILEASDDSLVVSEDEAINYIYNNASQLGISDVESTIQYDGMDTVLDNNYYDYSQTYSGIPVYGRKITLMTDANGEVLLVSGNYKQVSDETLTTATIGEDEIDASVKKYIKDTLVIENVENLEVTGITSDNMVIYNLDDSDHLAYLLNVNFYTDQSVEDYTFIVDANNAEVLLSSSNNIQENVATKTKDVSGSEVTINTWKENDDSYLLYDEERNIIVYDAEGKIISFDSIPSYEISVGDEAAYFREPKPQKVISSNNKDWSNIAVTLMKNVEYTYDWYKKIGISGWDNKNGRIVAICNDGGYNGENAYSCVDFLNNKSSYYTVLCYGKEMELPNLDLIAHEYGHSVQGGVVYMIYQGETGAIKEGYADIMGEIVENDINWYQAVGRNIANPNETQNPARVNDEYFLDTSDVSDANDHGGVHQNSTVISHTAYLMANGIDGDESKKLNNVQIAKLWYRTLKLCKVNTNFSELRECMCAVAKIMSKENEFSYEQYKCVEEAFDAVGIEGSATAVTTNSSIQFKDIYNEPLDNATVEIYNIFSQSDIKNKTVLGSVSNKLVAEKKTDDEGYISLKLSEGSYKLIITDTYNDDQTTYEKIIYCSNLARENAIITTPFRAGIVKDFAFDEEDLTLSINEKKVMKCYIHPDGAYDYEITWSSSDKSVAIVDSNGIIKGISNGTTTISATLKSGGSTYSAEATVTVTDKQRDTILVLDCSGSMSGEPMEEMKKSAIKFCEDILQDNENNRIEIISYSSYWNASSFTNDLNELYTYIDSLDDGSMTNMYDALQQANYDIENYGRENSVKNIIIMADGLPNDGTIEYDGKMTQFCEANGIYGDNTKYANAVCDLADTMMEKYNLYSLGFFHSLTSTEYTFCDELMSNLQNAGYYIVDKAENLQVSFGDISTEISDGSKIVITIACPVDVYVECEGDKLSSDNSCKNTETEFGTLTIEKVGTELVKILTLDADKDYDISINGTGYGEMDYSVSYFDEDDTLSDERTFENVPITANTKISTNTIKNEKTKLDIDSNGDGAVDSTWLAGENESGTESWKDEAAITGTVQPEMIEEKDDKSGARLIWLIVIIGCSVLLTILTIVLIVLLVKNSKQKRKETQTLSKEDKNEYIQKDEIIGESIVLAQGSITFNSGNYKGNSISIKEGEEIYIGKDASKVSIIVPNEYKMVSRVHCSISFYGKYKCFYITDYSSNGTYVNKKRMPKNVAMRLDKYSLVELSKNGFSFIVND